MSHTRTANLPSYSPCIATGGSFTVPVQIRSASQGARIEPVAESPQGMGRQWLLLGRRRLPGLRASVAADALSPAIPHLGRRGIHPARRAGPRLCRADACMTYWQVAPLVPVGPEAGRQPARRFGVGGPSLPFRKALGLILFAVLARRGFAPCTARWRLRFSPSPTPVRHGCEAKPYSFDLLMATALLLGAPAGCARRTRLAGLPDLARPGRPVRTLIPRHSSPARGA